jgi:hypothetical protein
VIALREQTLERAVGWLGIEELFANRLRLLVARESRLAIAGGEEDVTQSLMTCSQITPERYIAGVLCQ